MGRGAADEGPQIYGTVRRLRDATGLPLAFGGAVNAAQQVRLTEFAGANTGALRGVVLEAGRGLGGKVVALRRPIVVNDYVCSPAISHHYDRIIAAEGLRAMVAAPVVVRRNVRGVLYGAVRNNVLLGDRVIQSVLETARDLEQILAVQDELARRLDWLDEHAHDDQMREPANPQWELVREAYAELRILAQEVGDDCLRQRVDLVCAKLLAGGGAPNSQSKRVPALSAREVDVLACVALGWTNAQAASDLRVRQETVKSYLRSAMRKLGCHSRLEAVVTARRYGLLP